MEDKIRENGQYVFGVFSKIIKYRFFKCFIYLFLERGEGREKERDGNIDVRETWIACLSRAPNWEPGPQPRQVPPLGIKSAIFGFAGWDSIH